MLLLKKINFKILLIAAVIISVITWISYISAMLSPYKESEQNDWTLFEIFRFPTHTLFSNTFYKTSSLYRLGLIINVVFYSFLLERIIMLIRYYVSKHRNNTVRNKDT